MVSENENINLRAMQLKILEIFKAVDNVCRDNSLRYYAISGTAIGTVRHGGFIPWDDDIDIAMPRCDYNKFKSIANNFLPHNFRFVDCIEEKTLGAVIGRVYDENTTYVHNQTIGRYSKYNGLYVDIMPLDGVPIGKLAFILHMKRLDFWKRVFQGKCLSDARFSNDKPMRKMVKVLAGIVFSIIPRNLIISRFLTLASKYPFDDDKTIYLSRTWGIGSHDGMNSYSRYYKSDFSEYVEVPFEDTKIRLPKGYDRYLSGLYPNYMAPPPSEKQVPHIFSGIFDPVHSFRYYIAKHKGAKIGFALGSFDMFHVGHLNIIKRANLKCDFLIVGVNSDEVVWQRKGKKPIICTEDRITVLRNIKAVDDVVVADETDRMNLWRKHGFDVLFVGDDHKGEEQYNKLEKELATVGVEICYFPYTRSVSSSLIRSKLEEFE
jgi:cytidyltransferase-like protein